MVDNVTIACMDSYAFVFVGIGVVGFLASVYYRRVVRQISENDTLAFKAGWNWIGMAFGFFISIIFIAAGVQLLFF